MASFTSLRDGFGLQELSNWPFSSFAGLLVWPRVPQDILTHMDVKMVGWGSIFKSGRSGSERACLVQQPYISLCLCGLL